MLKQNQEIVTRFERLLSSYQKIAMFLLMPSLISAFSTAVLLFNKQYNLTLSMGIILAFRPLIPSEQDFALLLIALGVLVPFVVLGLFAAKGKLWCYLTGIGLYLADLIVGLILGDPTSVSRYIIMIVIHAVFLIAFAVGLIFYFKADKLLKAHPDAILHKE